MSSIILDHIDKVYPNGFHAVRDLSLEIADGEFLVLVGPSGCGKSTTLRMIAGLETPTGGTLRIGDQDVTTLPPQQRDLAMVFQSYALYPHKTVRANLEFGLRMRQTDPKTIGDRIEKAAKILDIERLLDNKPAQLSGGQRQRVALGRAIVREPKAFLLDEPLSNLDAKLRVQTRAELARMHRQLGATMIYVTHDQEEAMTLGDRVAILRDGVLRQVAPPMEIYREPADSFVAGFIGSPAMNFLEGKFADQKFKHADFELTLDRELPAGDIQLGVRPQDVQLQAEEADFQARVDVVQPLGSDMIVHLKLGEHTLTTVTPAEKSFTIDEQVGVRLPREKLHFFAGEEGKRVK